MRRTCVLALVVGLAACAAPIAAKVGPTTLKNLFWASELVAVGRDMRVFEVQGWRVAEFTVERVVKGDSTVRHLYYLAEPTWSCDVSTATVGEESLLFVRRVTAEYVRSEPIERPNRSAPPVTFGDQAVWWISHAGSGRMPIKMVRGGVKSVTLTTAVIEIPEALAPKVFDVSEYETTSSLPLEAIELFMQTLPVEPPPATPTVAKGPLSADQLRP